MAIAETVLRRRLLMLGPLAIAGAAGGAFLAMLLRMKDGSFDPRAVPNPLVGRRMPDFDLPALSSGFQGFSSVDVFGAGHPVLVNFFASWCVPCVIEAPVFADLHKAAVAIWGIAYKDKPADTQSFLARHGNPYQRVARDEPGRVAIDFGVYGVPETYFVDKTGVVRWRWAGPLTQDSVTRELQPLLQHYS